MWKATGFLPNLGEVSGHDEKLLQVKKYRRDGVVRTGYHPKRKDAEPAGFFHVYWSRYRLSGDSSSSDEGDSDQDARSGSRSQQPDAANGGSSPKVLIQSNFY